MLCIPIFFTIRYLALKFKKCYNKYILKDNKSLWCPLKWVKREDGVNPLQPPLL